MATAGQVVTLTAAVTSGSQPVTAGTVTFFNGAQPLGTVQIKKSDGTATLKTRFAPGSDTLTARYSPNKLFQSSTSTPEPLIVTGTEPTTSTLSAVPDGSNYDFTLNVFGYGYPAPTGTASLEETSQQIHLGDFALAGAGAFTFQPPQTYATGTEPNGNAVGDFDGDGIVDLAIANFSNGTIGVLLGNGDGTFKPQKMYAAPPGPIGIAVADFDADGFPDLAVTNQSNGQVSVLLNNGDGTFKSPQSYPVGFAPNGIAAADFNGDGIADLVIANRDGTVSVLLGKGDGTFQAQVPYAVGSTSFGVAVNDFDGDGIPDLAVTNAADNTVSVLLGNGDGTFQPQQTYNTGAFPRLITSGDFDRDGKADLAVTNQNDNTVSVLLGNGNGTFQPQVPYAVGSGPTGIAVDDFDGDGFPDLAITDGCAVIQCQGVGTVSVLLGKGDGTFQPQQQYATGGDVPLGIAVADFNGDGVPDLAAANQGSNNVSVLISGTSTIAQLTNIPVLGQGTQTAQSTYSPNTQFYTGGKSNSLQLTGTQLATMTMVSVDINPSQYLQQVTFTATVTATNNGSPTGTVSFSSDEQGALCNAVSLSPISNGSVATCVVSLNVVGSHLITAAYSGDNNYSPSSGALIQIVNRATTTTALVANPPNQQVFGQPVTLTATITGAFGGVPTGTVDFTESNRLINLCLGVQLVNGMGTCQTTALPQGEDSILATYGGDTNFVGSNMSLPYKIVAAGSATTLSLNPPSPIMAGQVETLTATVTSNSQPVTAGTVTVFSGTTPLGTVQIKKSDGTATLKTRFAPGSDTLTARYNGTSQIGISTSAPQPLLVTGTEPTTSTLSAVPDGSNYDFTLNVFGFGYPAPTGMASLDELQVPPIHLGDFTFSAQGSVAMQAEQTYPVGNEDMFSAVGDFNGDGIPDLVVSNRLDQSLTIYLGVGDGTFGSRQTLLLPGGALPWQVVVGDFNGDGNLDIAVACQTVNGVELLFGNGDGTFQSPSLLAFGAAAQWLAVGDFNNDGLPDFAVASTPSTSIGVLTNNGNGTFTAHQQISVGSSIGAIAVGDFNGDGNLDIVSADPSSKKIWMVPGSGDGELGTPTGTVTVPPPFTLIAADFNHDGKLDLAVAYSSSASVLGILLGNGNGTFQETDFAVGSGITGIATADWNRDNVPDLAVSYEGQELLTVLRGFGDGTFEVAGSFNLVVASYSITAADLNGDGVPDIVGSTQLNEVGVSIAGTAITSTLSNIPVLGQGMQTVQSTYSPNVQFYGGGTSNSLQLTGTQLTTTTTLTADVNPSQYLQPVTFTATVTASNNGSPTGTVSFTDASQLLCSATLTTISGGSVATCVISLNIVGSHLITATYSGDNNYLSSQGTLTQMVIQAVTSVFPQETPPNPVFGQLVTLTGTVTGAFGGTPTGTMDFTESNHQINLCLGVQLVNGIATCQTSALPLGPVKVFYSYSGDANFLANGAFLNFRVLGTASATTLSISPPSPIGAGRVETLTAAVTSNNEPVPAGTVTFFNGTTPLGTAQMKQADGTATLKTRFAPGSATLTARYNGTNQINLSTSAPQSLIATGTEPTISTLTATPNGSNYDFSLNVFGFGFPAPTGTASLDETSLNIHLGDFSLAAPGAVSLAPGTVYSVGTQPVYLATGDLNGDGYVDAVVSNVGDNSLSVLLGNPDGSFQAQSKMGFPGQVGQVVLADFNGDGFLDIAVPSRTAPTNFVVDVLLGNGDGTFQPAQSYSVSDPFELLATGDFNGDGFPDLIGASGSGIAVVLLNNGDGTFKAGSEIFPLGPFGMAIGDFNRDGIPDVAFTDNFHNQVTVAIGKGDGTFTLKPNGFPVGEKPVGIVAGDFKRDGTDDLAVANNGATTVSILIGNGDGTFQPQQTYDRFGSSPYAIVITDSNGDGILDLAVSNPNSSLVDLMIGNGDGTFQPRQAKLGIAGGLTLAAADLNGDGVPDLLTTVSPSNNLGVLLAGTSTTAQLTNIAVPGSGQETAQATYAPDANAAIYAGSMSNVVTVTGSPNSTVTLLTADFNPSGITEAVTFRATVTGSSGSPTGTVTFTADGTNLCAAVPLQPLTNAGFATCMTSNLAFGDHTIVATYSGDSLYVPSASTPLTETIQKISNYVVTLTVQAQNQGSSILLTASVQPRHCDLICIPPAQVVPTGTVTFGPSLQDLTSLGTAQLNSQAMASVTVTNPGALSVIYAQYLGDANFIPVISNPQDSVAPPLVVQSATTTAGSVLSVALNLTVDFPPGANYFKEITCNAPIALGITCTPNPAIITSNSQADVDIRTSGSISYLRTPGSSGGDGYRLLALATQLGLPAVVWLGFASGPRRRRKGIAGSLLVLLVCSPILMTSCGGSFAPGTPPGGSSSATPPGTYFITGTATLYKKAAAQAGGDLQIGTPQSFLIQLLVK